ncbi:MAG TPA: glycosyltransferase, partial [Flavobacteriales bacterium]|nr:glycosyltransferase [Flavobacteriales bacterium]
DVVSPLKPLEPMAMGKCVISTAIGAEGIGYTDGHDLLLANSATAMAGIIGSLIEDPARARTIGLNARQLVLKQYTNDGIVKDLVAFFGSLPEA